MAIQYLSSINLTTNQLQYAVIQPATTDPTLYTPAEGQVYYNSVNKKLKLYTGTISGWVDVGAGVTSFAATDGTFINLTPNTTQTGAATLIADLSATGTPDNTKYLRGDNTWSPVSGISGTTYDLDTIQVASNVAIVLVGSDSTTDTVTLVAGTN
ncbi:MAG: hypothetical protein ACOVOV_19020, partial [Dolichospermum sp.]